MVVIPDEGLVTSPSNTFFAKPKIEFDLNDQLSHCAQEFADQMFLSWDEPDSVEEALNREV